MSIHKSKGLEFPVVFLSNTGKQFNLTDLNQSILLHQDMGIGVKYIDYDKQIQYNTLTKVALKNKILTETLSEEMRILYVALTRAKEKIYITATVKDYEKKQEEMRKQISKYEIKNGKINPILVKKYKKYIDWILLVLGYEDKNLDNTCTLQILDKNKLLNSFEEKEKEEKDLIKELNETKVDNKEVEKIKEKLEFKYKYENSTKTITKTSVSNIKKLKQESKENQAKQESQTITTNNKANNIEDNDEEENEENKLEFLKPEFLKDSKEEKITPAKKGTLIHRTIQQLSEKKEYTYEDIKNMIEEMKSKNIFTQKEAESIDINKILQYTKSEIWKELKEAKKVYKEKPFYINIPAKEIDSNNNSDDNILVQGIIDLYYITKDDKLVLVDYKTDYIKKGEEQKLIERYKVQMELYEKALTKALNRKVDKKIIYSVTLGSTNEL